MSSTSMPTSNGDDNNMDDDDDDGSNNVIICSSEFLTDDVGDEQVRALAAALAPQIRELENLMDDPLFRSSHDDDDNKDNDHDPVNTKESTTPQPQKPRDSKVVISDDDEDDEAQTPKKPNAAQPADDTTTMIRDDDDDSEAMMEGLDDDDMDQELEQLAFAEDILRRELDLAKEFASFFGSSPTPSLFSSSPDPSGALAGGFRNMTLDFTTSTTATSAGIAPTSLFHTAVSAPDLTTVKSKPVVVTQKTEESQLPMDTTATSNSNNNPQATVSPPSSLQQPSAAAAPVVIQQMEADLDGDEDDPDMLVEQQDASTKELKENNTSSKFDPKLTQQETLHFDAEAMEHIISNHHHQSIGSITLDTVGTALQSAKDAVAETNNNNNSTNQQQQTTTTTTVPQEPPKEPATTVDHPKSNPAVPPTQSSSSSSNNKNNTNKHSNNNNNKYATPRRRRHHDLQEQTPATPQTSIVLWKAPQYNYTSNDHFKSLLICKEPQGAWYSVDLTAHLLVQQQQQHSGSVSDTGSTTTSLTEHNNNNNIPSTVGIGIKEYCLSITQWKRLFVGLRVEGDEEKQQIRRQQKLQQQTTTTGQQPPSTPQHTLLDTSSSIQQPTSPPSSNKHRANDPSSPAPHHDDVPHRKAPVRTISIRIRPDVLCGAVMDAVTQTLVNCPHASIIKRQGGHLQATVRGQVIPPPTQANNNMQGSPNVSMDSTATPRRSSSSVTSIREYTFFVDAQLCTHKSPACERVLLLRIFHWGKEDQDATEEGDLWSPSSSNNNNNVVDSNNPFAQPSDEQQFLIDGEQFNSNFPQSPNSTMQQHQQAHQANRHLREACALIQRIESPELARKMRPLVHKTTPTQAAAAELRDLISEHLLHNYRACPSVLRPDTTITLPALSPHDWPIIQAAWGWIQSVWDELETRELTYLSFLPMLSWMTMMPPAVAEADGITQDEFTTPPDHDSPTPVLSLAPPVPRFGAFPALPTLDVQYCSQLRRLSRESMIGQLLKAASVLEDYARQAEYQCANLIDLLRPTFAYYGVDTPSLPKPAPLSAYPLEYTPPQSLCPPWGMKVMEAMNQVTAMSHQQNAMQEEPQDPESMQSHQQQQALESLAMAETAVQMVYDAFQEQDDEEHSARLARKNLQVMDRLAKMQEHNRASIHALSISIPTSGAAKAAADEFFAKAGNGIIGLLHAKNGTRGAPLAEREGLRTSVHAPPFREVPLMKWTMGVGGSSGTCTITANQILFTPAKLIPLLSHSQSTWFHMADVEFGIVTTPPTLLNPLSTMIQVLDASTGTPVYSFKPSSAGPRLKSFLDIVQKESAEAMAANVRVNQELQEQAELDLTM
ncbi:expressed unknown protein [Seminavis robusta]|uniref:Uncharacterized protein n=1 Tax=Seminavis robusta TaxID=568900 RepID=A0A9N8ETA8_9STRA|nr:expressed unknown protein [Seminavis robusta]|eukprot:Sro1890_g303670.1 n/a (1338) ;mRNA; f:1421-5434